MTDELNALAERVEQATGPDRELDADIYSAFGYCTIRAREHATAPCWQYYGSGALGDQRARANMRPFTASLDAAMTLIDDELVTVVMREALDRLDECFNPLDNYLTKLRLFACAAALRARGAKENKDA